MQVAPPILPINLFRTHPYIYPNPFTPIPLDIHSIPIAKYRDHSMEGQTDQYVYISDISHG